MLSASFRFPECCQPSHQMHQPAGSVFIGAGLAWNATRQGVGQVNSVLDLTLRERAVSSWVAGDATWWRRAVAVVVRSEIVWNCMWYQLDHKVCSQRRKLLSSCFFNTVESVHTFIGSIRLPLIYFKSSCLANLTFLCALSRLSFYYIVFSVSLFEKMRAMV